MVKDYPNLPASVELWANGSHDLAVMNVISGSNCSNLQPDATCAAGEAAAKESSIYLLRIKSTSSHNYRLNAIYVSLVSSSILPT